MLHPIRAFARLTNDKGRISSAITKPSSPPRALAMARSAAGALAALAALALLPACQAETAPAVKSERAVQVQRVAFGAEDAAREFVGVVRARYETDLGFRVAGKIVARVVNVGDRVRVGDVVARLDP